MINAAVDNDILYKGAGFGLLRELLSAIPAAPSGVGILGAARFVVAKRLKRAKLTDALPLFQAVVSEVNCLEPTEAEAELAAQLEYEAQRANLNVDEGESLLCAMVVTRALAWLVTGDKRAIAGLEKFATTRADVRCLAGKAVCLEQLVLRLLNGGDASGIRSAICTHRTLDRALVACFSCASPEVDQESWERGLESYVGAVRASAPTLLAT